MNRHCRRLSRRPNWRAGSAAVFMSGALPRMLTMPQLLRRGWARYGWTETKEEHMISVERKQQMVLFMRQPQPKNRGFLEPRIALARGSRFEVRRRGKQSFALRAHNPLKTLSFLKRSRQVNPRKSNVGPRESKFSQTWAKAIQGNPRKSTSTGPSNRSPRLRRRRKVDSSRGRPFGPARPAPELRVAVAR